MSENELKPIGGYLELELPPSRGHYYNNALLFNSGRSCFAYSLNSENIHKVFLPYYSCDSLLEPLKYHKIEYEFYWIDENFEIIAPPILRHDEKLLYINYYGLKQKYVRSLAQKYTTSLIVDNTQGFFSLPSEGVSTFYSPRKFFGVPDGGYLVSATLGNKSPLHLQEHLMEYTHLVGRIEYGPQACFDDYQRNEAKLSYDGIKRISRFSERILSSIDYANIKSVRERNFLILHKSLDKYNKLKIDAETVPGPLCYPLWIKVENLRKKLIENLIFVPIYWKEVLGHIFTVDAFEKTFVNDILPLPIDQRYTPVDMQRIIDTIIKEL